jgi:hypothetical protein
MKFTVFAIILSAVTGVVAMPNPNTPDVSVVDARGCHYVCSGGPGGCGSGCCHQVCDK